MGHGLPVLARLTDGLMVNPNLDLGSREHRLPSAWQVGFHESLFDEILRYHQRYPRRVPRWPGDNTVNVKFHLRFTKHDIAFRWVHPLRGRDQRPALKIAHECQPVIFSQVLTKPEE